MEHVVEADRKSARERGCAETRMYLRKQVRKGVRAVEVLPEGRRRSTRVSRRARKG